MTSTYDVVVIGAGPAGLAAARGVNSSPGAPSVLLADKTEPWKNPIPCAEGVFCVQFHQTVHHHPSWVRCLVDKAVFHSPDHSTIRYKDRNKGYILDRALMQKELADECLENGVECLFGKRVTQVGSRDRCGIRTVRFDDGRSVGARVVIDCSGPLSSFGKGERIHCKAVDLEVACLAHIRLPSFETDTVHIYAGSNVAPGGYAWAFPRSEGKANVGVIVGNKFRARTNVRRLLEEFIREHFPQATVERNFAGTIPCTYGRYPLATYGLIKAGDAASTINPISRAGISEAMMSGSLAATCAVAMLGAATTRQIASACKHYEKAWHKKRGKRHAKLARVKNSLANVPDSDYNAGARSLSAIPLERLTMSKIFSVSLARFPRLVWALRHVL